MTKLFANSGDPDQTPPSAASDLGLHCLPSTILLVYRPQWDKYEIELRDSFRNWFCFQSGL